MDSYVGLAGWAFLPSFITNVLQSIWYSFKYPVNSGAKPAPNTPKHRRHYNRIYCGVVLAYLAYTIVEVDRSTPTNCYDLLDINFHTFSQKQLRTNFRKASLMYHPDKVGEVGADTFVRIRAAHEILSDPVIKVAYDRFGPDLALTCTTCKTTKDYIQQGLMSFYTFYLGSGIVLVLMSVLGKGQFGRYWRFIVLFGMAALELAMVTRAAPLTLLSWVMPHRVTFEQVAILHQIFISTFIAISQIGPILVPSKEQEKSNIKDLITRLELLTAISQTESVGQLQSVFDVYRGDEACMTQLKRQMGMMALDARLTQDQMLNEARSAVQRRLLQRKNT
ncbi:hypothetical protein BC939DRAFT_503611 [Gamsiella multidivaricata]|uniref:uncharacterized protein n=1 Tax=Gamsiella multidivaricata TaxID=101098 RepID=UPI00221F54D5|nr:uncharacterized protein BC939DRAFT_503611 [Gamsiella multidivaricata]KAG0370868.1 hypothetical protein BGZ54_003294 [Gamsiella multidivaricata]KAI7822926.1 hypothetical protein BC939DRAFT_503611 [Gamsiella multidivaricata]